MWTPENSPMSDSELYSPRTMHDMLEYEEEEMDEAIAEELRFRENHGIGAMTDGQLRRLRRARAEVAERKKAVEDAVEAPVAAPENLPPPSPVYEYGASESSDEPFSDEERGPAVVDQPPAAVDQPPAAVDNGMAEANVVNEDDSGISGTGSGSGSADDEDMDVDDADVVDDSDSDAGDSKGSDASEVTSAPAQ